jgi:Sec-independent protein secretion pathway component TatC
MSMESVANFQITMLLGWGVAFELPVILGLLGWLGLVSARGMWRFNKYALVLAACAGAILTPGNDAYSQMFLAIPLYLLYNLSIAVVWIIQRQRSSLPELNSPLVLMVAAWPAVRRHLSRPPRRASGAWSVTPR